MRAFFAAITLVLSLVPAAAAFLLLCVCAAPALSDSFVTVRSKSGATARVASSAAPKFQCLIDALDASGYRIRVMGGYRAGTCATANKHACGTAIDIDQTARDVTLKGFPRSQSTQLAKACGLTPGSVWRNADTGHFEIPGVRRAAAHE